MPYRLSIARLCTCACPLRHANISSRPNASWKCLGHSDFEESCSTSTTPRMRSCSAVVSALSSAPPPSTLPSPSGARSSDRHACKYANTPSTRSPTSPPPPPSPASRPPPPIPCSCTQASPLGGTVAGCCAQECAERSSTFWSTSAHTWCANAGKTLSNVPAGKPITRRSISPISLSILASHPPLPASLGSRAALHMSLAARHITPVYMCVCMRPGYVPRCMRVRMCELV